MTRADAASPPSDISRLRAAAARYFAGERRDAMGFTLLGAANLGAAAAVVVAAPAQRLLAMALCTIGVLELLPGLWAVRRQVARAAEADQAIGARPAAWKTEEAARLRRLLEARRRLRIADAAFVLAFVVVVLLAPPGERLTWIAVPGQMAVLPLLNVAMERRARRLLAAIEPGPGAVRAT